MLYRNSFFKFSLHLPNFYIELLFTCGDGPPTPRTGPDDPIIGPPGGGGAAGIPRPAGYLNNQNNNK